MYACASGRSGCEQNDAEAKMNIDLDNREVLWKS